MEINPRHPLVIELNKLAEDDPESEKTIDNAWLLYDTALLNSGFSHDDVENFTARMYRTLQKSLDLPNLELEDEVEFEEEEEEEEEGEDEGTIDFDFDTVSDEL